MRKRLAVFLALWMLLAAGCTAKPIEIPDAATSETAEQTPTQEPADVRTQTGGELAVAPEEFLSARYITRAPDGASYVAADDNGELVLLESSADLTNLWISRVEFDPERQDYIRTERLWWQNQWKAGGKIVIQMKITKEYPTMEVSWEDEFGQRERRLIEFSRLFVNRVKTETVKLLYFISPLQPTDLTQHSEYYYDMDTDGRKEIIRFTRPDKTAGEQAMAALKITKGSTVFEYHMLLVENCKCYLADLDGDYAGEIYISGKTAEGRQLSYALGLSDVGIVPMNMETAAEDANHLPVLLGSIEKMEARVLYLTDTVYIFAKPCTAHCSYGYSDGQLQPISGTWTLDAGTTAKLKHSVAFVTENGAEKSLPAGTVLQPLESDLSSFVKVQTASGEVGTLHFTADEDGAWIISGHYDSDLFA